MADRSLRLQLEPSSYLDGIPVSDHHEVDSRARSFFLANKDLFEYDKYVGNTDPFDPACSSPSRGPFLSFLDRYRACDEQYSSANDGASYLLAVPALASSILSILLPSMTSRSTPPANYRIPATFSASPLLASPSGEDGCYNRQHQHRYNWEQQLALSASYQPGMSPPRPLGSLDGRQRFAFDTNPAGLHSEFAMLPTYDQRFEHHEHARSPLQHWQSIAASSILYNGSPPRQ